MTSAIGQNSINWANKVNDYVKPAAIRSFPPISCALSFISGLTHLVPLLIYDERDEMHPESIIVNTKLDLREVRDFYLQKGFVFSNRFKEERPFLAKVEEIIEKRFLFNYEQVEKFNEQFNCEAKLCFTLDKPEHISPYMAIGGKSSPSNPLIVMSLPQFKITSDEVLQTVEGAFIQADASFNPDEKKFVLAHEFVHIQNNDNLVLRGIQTLASILNVGAWLQTSSSSWLSYFAISFMKSFAIELTAELGYSLYSKHIEDKADQGAMNAVGTNQGALAFFNNLSKLYKASQTSVSNHLHPDLQSRIQKAKLWKPQSDAA